MKTHIIAYLTKVENDFCGFLLHFQADFICLIIFELKIVTHFAYPGLLNV